MLLLFEMCLFTNHSCYGACMMVLPLYSFNPLLSSQLRKVIFCGRHVLASVWDIKIVEALLILCLAYYVMRQIQHSCNLGVMAFTYRDIGCTFHEFIILCISHNGWMNWRDAFLLILLRNRHNIAEYEVYWLMGVPIICSWGVRQPF